MSRTVSSTVRDLRVSIESERTAWATWRDAAANATCAASREEGGGRHGEAAEAVGAAFAEAGAVGNTLAFGNFLGGDSLGKESLTTCWYW